MNNCICICLEVTKTYQIEYYPLILLCVLYAEVKPKPGENPLRRAKKTQLSKIQKKKRQNRKQRFLERSVAKQIKMVDTAKVARGKVRTGIALDLLFSSRLNSQLLHI